MYIARSKSIVANLQHNQLFGMKSSLTCVYTYVYWLIFIRYKYAECAWAEITVHPTINQSHHQTRLVPIIRIRWAITGCVLQKESVAMGDYGQECGRGQGRFALRYRLWFGRLVLYKQSQISMYVYHIVLHHLFVCVSFNSSQISSMTFYFLLNGAQLIINLINVLNSRCSISGFTNDGIISARKFKSV